MKHFDLCYTQKFGSGDLGKAPRGLRCIVVKQFGVQSSSYTIRIWKATAFEAGKPTQFFFSSPPKSCFQLVLMLQRFGFHLLFQIRTVRTGAGTTVHNPKFLHQMAFFFFNNKKKRAKQYSAEYQSCPVSSHCFFFLRIMSEGVPSIQSVTPCV